MHASRVSPSASPPRQINVMDATRQNVWTVLLILAAEATRRDAFRDYAGTGLPHQNQPPVSLLLLLLQVQVMDLTKTKSPTKNECCQKLYILGQLNKNVNLQLISLICIIGDG